MDDDVLTTLKLLIIGESGVGKSRLVLPSASLLAQHCLVCCHQFICCFARRPFRPPRNAILFFKVIQLCRQCCQQCNIIKTRVMPTFLCLFILADAHRSCLQPPSWNARCYIRFKGFRPSYITCRSFAHSLLLRFTEDTFDPDQSATIGTVYATHKLASFPCF